MADKKTLGFAMCGSFCTLSRCTELMKELSQYYNIVPVMSEITYSTDTRFGTAEHFKDTVKEITGKDIIHTIKDAEPIGPKALFDCMLIAPCTGNTLTKLSLGITDTAVTMAAKAHIRNNRPLVIALSTNDALSNSAKNIGTLLNYKNVFFVPFSQDAPDTKPRSCIARFEFSHQTIENALKGIQIQPIIM